MKKLLFLILIALFVTLSVYVVLQGISIGGIKILSFKQIQDESLKLDEKIQQAAKLAEKDYVQSLAQIDTDLKKLQQEKENYEEMTSVSTEGEVIAANQLETYEWDSLMVKLGNHATSKGAIADIETVTTGATDIYNLNITATGSYISITDFISAIENDSTLGFKIEEFKMSPSEGTSVLQANFKCKGITIKGISSVTSSNTENETEEVQDGATENTTDKTKDNATENTTNKTTDNTTTQKTTNENNTSNTTKKTNTGNTTKETKTTD